MSITSTYIHVKNPLNWLRWILAAILLVTLFVIVTNGHSQMTEYTRLYLDDGVKQFLHLTDWAIGAISLAMLLLAILLLVVVDYCVWVSFDKLKYKIVILLLAAAVNVFWWNFNQESFKRKKVEQLGVIAPPDLKPETTSYDEQIAFVQRQLDELSRELRQLGNLDSSAYYVVIRSNAKRKTQINEERYLLMEQLRALQEKQAAALEQVQAHNTRQQAEHEEASLQAAAVGQQIGRGIEVFLFCLMAVLHLLGNKTKRVELGNATTERFVSINRNHTYQVEDGKSEKLIARTRDMFQLPSAKELGVSSRRYDKFSGALPHLMEIARNDGEGLNEFCRQYAEENPEVKASTLKNFYTEIKNNLEPAAGPVPAPKAEKKGNILEDAREQVHTWIKSVAPAKEQVARDIFD